MNPLLKAQIGGVFADIREVVPRLWIEDKGGRDVQMTDPFSEQIDALDDFTAEGVNLVVHCKPRQTGDSTIACAANFYETYTSGGPLRTLIATDSDETTDVLFRKVHRFHEGLPPPLQREKLRSNKKEMFFKDTRAGIRCITAGGRSRGRGWTFQRLQAEELAFWGDSAEATWGSITSTMKEDVEKAATWIISTPNGPGNFYHQKVIAAQRAQLMGDPSVRFRFFAWSDHRGYRKQPPASWEPDEEEWQLGQQYGLDLQQLYWRHDKIYGPRGIGPETFRREYPLTVEDGFLVEGGAWFNVTYLNDVLSTLEEVEGEVRIHRQPERGTSYAAGIDPSWCTGNDAFCVQILDDLGYQCATLEVYTGGLERAIEMAVDLCASYRAKTLIEANTGGAGPIVIKAFQAANLPLWTEPVRSKNRVRATKIRNWKFWTTGRGNKAEAYDHGRKMVNGDALTLLDPPTITQLMHIREENGRIEGQDGLHDDLADALVLAEWCRRDLPVGGRLRVRSSKRRPTAYRNPFAKQRRLR